MNPLFGAALEVQSFMQERGWRFCVIGGLALARWGEPRATQDVDITLFAGFGAEEPYVAELLSRFPARVSEPAEFARKNRVLLLRAANGVPVDLALGGIPFEEQAVRRATPFEFASGVSLVTCSAEDLIVLKCFADREQDWLDVRGILVRQGGRLDWRYLREQLAPLCELKAAPQILHRLEQLRQATESP